MASQKDSETSLKPTLSLFDATAVSVGAIIGAGIFVVTGVAAGLAGSAFVISMLMAAAVSLLTALSFVELTAWMPKEGSVYEYAYRLISPFAGFISGWMWIFSNTFTGAAVALGFAQYFTALFPVMPSNVTAALLSIAFTAMNYFGVRKSALLNNFLVTTKLAILAFFVILGTAYANLGNYAPFSPFSMGVPYAAYFVFFAYGGFARVAVISEEVKDARRNVPRAILLSLGISTAVYMLVGVVALGLVGAGALAASGSPLAAAMEATGSKVAVYVISAGAMLATSSVLLTSILGVSRVAYAMAKRRDLPQFLGKLHSKHATPYYSVLLVGAFTTAMALFADLSGVVAMSTFALLFYYAFANVSALRLQNRARRYSRLVPAAGTAACLAMLVLVFFVSPQALIVGVVCVLAGVAFYVAMKALRKDEVSGQMLRPVKSSASS